MKEISFKWLSKLKRLHLIYVFGFLINFRPSDPFSYESLNSWKNLNENQVNHDVYPFATYSTAIQLTLVVILLDFCNYNPFILIFSAAGIVAKSILIWTDSLFELQVAEVLYGTFAATEISYYVYIYAHGDISDYQRLTSYVRAAPLAGKTLSYLLSQLLVWQVWPNYKELNYITLSFFILSLPVAVALPFASENIFLTNNEKVAKPRIAIAATIIQNNFISTFSDKYMAKWSLWIALTLGGFSQVTTCVQPLWRLRQIEYGESLYNGAVEGVLALIGFFAVLLAGVAKFDWRLKGDLILTLISLLQGFMLVLASQIDDSFLIYLFYVFFGILFHFGVTVLSAEIVKGLKRWSFGLVFGIIALIGAVSHAILAGLLTDDTGFELASKDQFLIYGAYHLGVAILFIVIGLASWFAKRTYL